MPIPEQCVSRDCQDLLGRLLKHDPEQRISYEELFAHPFLDLEHLPSEESYRKGVALVHEAVRQDAAKEFRQAFVLYCQALQYFVPYIQAEKDPEKKAGLTSKVAEYTKRAEELKSILHPPKVTKESSVTSPSVSSESSAEHTPSHTPTTPDLITLCSTTPALKDALDIGTSAQMYLAEGQYQLALDKFQASLGVLVPLLATEPLGVRKDLLYRQIQDWLKQAESVKALQSYVKMNQTSPQSIAEKVSIVDGSLEIAVNIVDGSLEIAVNIVDGSLEIAVNIVDGSLDIAVNIVDVIIRKTALIRIWWRPLESVQTIEANFLL
ncbi:Serine/threonine-protein kinase ulk3 [Homalodisca vitripennis]|nr:Serine/threonine-protein kinase ulk3 [Homalodisca vitripennis]